MYKAPKQYQIIWLDVDTLQKLLDIYTQITNRSMAINTFISEILKFFVSDPDTIEKFTAQIRKNPKYFVKEL